jgi:hypothetical protein
VKVALALSGLLQQALLMTKLIRGILMRTPIAVELGHQLKMMLWDCMWKPPWGGQTCNLDQTCRYRNESRRCIEVLPVMNENISFHKNYKVKNQNRSTDPCHLISALAPITIIFMICSRIIKSVPDYEFLWKIGFMVSDWGWFTRPARISIMNNPCTSLLLFSGYYHIMV